MNFIFILIILICLVYIIIIFDNRNMIYIISDIDNELYLVRDLNDKQTADNMLAKIKQTINKLNNYLFENKETYTDYSRYIEQLNNRIKYTIISENNGDSNTTSYSVNKGDELVICIRNYNTNEFHDFNLIMYVVLHEISHIACPEIGHGDLFKKIFAFMTNTAIKLNLYKKINFDINPADYCGIKITGSIV